MWLMLLRISTDSGHRVVVPIPIFPLWILAAPLVAALAIWNLCKRRDQWRLMRHYLSILAHLGGLTIDVSRPSSHTVKIQFL